MRTKVLDHYDIGIVTDERVYTARAALARLCDIWDSEAVS